MALPDFTTQDPATYKANIDSTLAKVGGNTAGDIITTDDTQTLTSKTLTSPVINTEITGSAITTTTITNGSSLIPTSNAVYDHISSRVGKDIYSVGAYCFAKYTGPETVVMGLDTVSGSDLEATNVYGGTEFPAYFLSGVWQCMGYVNTAGGTGDNLTLFLRLS